MRGSVGFKVVSVAACLVVVAASIVAAQGGNPAPSASDRLCVLEGLHGLPVYDECVPPTTTSTTTTAPPTTTTVAPTTTTVAPTTTTTTTTTVPSSAFSEDFADPASFNRFSTISWTRDISLGGGLDEGYSFQGDHAPIAGSDPDACTNPFTTRELGRATRFNLVEDPTDHVYRCAPGDNPDAAHLMVAQGPTSGYDFAAAWTNETFSGVTEVRWDQNITDLGGRNWSEVKLVPAATWNPLQPPCGTFVSQCRTGAAGGASVPATPASTGSVVVSWFSEQPELETPLGEDDEGWWFRPDVNNSIRQQLEARDQAFSSPAPRYTHILTDNGDGTVTLSIDTTLPDFGVFEVATVNGSFPADFHLVLATHDYTSDKGNPSFAGVTWHFDNIVIE